jgi:hypothetical protein
LNAVAEHWAVDLLEQATRDVNGQVGAYADQLGVERGVVELAQRQSIGNDRIPLRCPIGNDVSSVEQLGMVQTAHGAALAARAEHAGWKRRLDAAA